jgi:hypothetical protein
MNLTTTGVLGRGELVKIAYRLGRESATGRLVVTDETAGGRGHELFVRRGYLTYADVGSARIGELLVASGAVSAATLERSLRARGARLTGQTLRAEGVSDAALEAALRRQAELRLERLCAIPSASFRFEPGAAAPPAHRSGRPIALSSWTRRHVEAELDVAGARALAGRIAGKRLALRKDLAPDATECDDTDRRILLALAAPRQLAEISKAARAPERRLLTFLHFLIRVGALAFPSTSPTALHEALGVAAGSDLETIRQAYHRLARQLHPDLHPGLPADARRALEAELAAVNLAYRKLCKTC